MVWKVSRLAEIVSQEPPAAPSWSVFRAITVHTYGFKAGKCTDDVIALVRQLLFLVDAWGFELHCAVQDVLTAFDSMDHDLMFAALRQRGVRPGRVAANARELTVLQAVISLTGAGDSEPPPFTRGGKQGGVETADEWNALIEFVLGPIVNSWADKHWGVDLDGHLINHAIWVDKI